MRYLKHIPNLMTLGNLSMGCIAIVLFTEANYAMFSYDIQNADFTIRFFSEQLVWGSFFVMFAAILDMLDGLVARWLKVESALGEQLDSLADVVSFGVAPGVLLFEMLKYSWASAEANLNVPFILLLPSLAIPCFGAYRLARFNTYKAKQLPLQQDSFIGVPIPATGLAIVALPWAFITISPIKTVVYNPYTLYGIIFLFSWMMVSTHRMYKINFNMKNWRNVLTLLTLSVISVIGFFVIGYLILFVAVLCYIILSFLFVPKYVPEDERS